MYTTIFFSAVIVLKCVSKNKDIFTYKKNLLETDKIGKKYSEWCPLLLIGKLFKADLKVEQY